MCVRDRVNLSHLPIVKPDSCLNCASKMALQLLPNKGHDRKSCSVCVTYYRIIHTFFEFGFSDVATWHTEHHFYKEMSEKSEVVSKSSFLYLLTKYTIDSLGGVVT